MKKFSSIILLLFCAASNLLIAVNSEKFEISPVFERNVNSVLEGSKSNDVEMVAINKEGSILSFSEYDNNAKIFSLFYWSQESGLRKIDIHNDILQLGFEPKSLVRNGITSFQPKPYFVHNNGTILLKFELKGPGFGLQNTDKYNTIFKLALWSEEKGFRYLDLKDIVTVVGMSVYENSTIIRGKNDNHEQILVVFNNRELFGENDVSQANKLSKDVLTLDTPWDNLPLGDIGARLYAMQSLVKKQKSKKDKQALFPMVESEAAYIIDVLQYKAKKAEYLLLQSQENGQSNEQAEKDYREAMSGISAIEKMLKDMSISTSKVFSMELPSTNWEPAPIQS
jgi:hypothetical protein